MSRIRVLLAEDEPILRAELADVVSSAEGFDLVGTAADTTEAISMAVSLKPAVAVLDVRMPGGGGEEAARAIRQRSAGTRILALSAYGDRETVFAMIRAGACGYVLKGSTVEEILAGIEKAALGGGAISNELAGDIVETLGEELRDREAKESAAMSRARAIQEVIDGDGLSMVFQPVVELQTRRVAGFEALARFAPPPPRGPDLWFAEAEAAGLRQQLEIEAVRRALADGQSRPEGSYLALNASPETLLSKPFAAVLSNSNAGSLVVEVTEHAPISDYGSIRDAMSRLQRSGCKLAVDDAGAGFASLRHILELKPAFIKLDISLTRGIDANQDSRALSSAMLTFADSIGAKIIAEGIETESELLTLMTLGVRFGQGYLLGRPTPMTHLDGVN